MEPLPHGYDFSRHRLHRMLLLTYRRAAGSRRDARRSIRAMIATLRQTEGFKKGQRVWTV